jgi:DNA-cytosine methyltransferase
MKSETTNPQSEKLRAWDEAHIVNMPVPEKKLDKPIVLVERNRNRSIISPHGDEFVSLPGHPVISLFTGAGGMDIGIEEAGFCCVLQHEWSQFPCCTLVANRPRFFRHAALIQGDIRQTPTEMILEHAGLRVGQAEIVCGGPPCQGFTTANTNAVHGKYDSRNDLVFEFLRVVREAAPAYFIFENVPGFQQFNKGDYAEKFLHAAYHAFYEMVYGLIDACDYGVPQRRVRFICMGTRRDIALIEGKIATLPAGSCFGHEDLSLLQSIDGAPLFTREQKRIMRPPGIRYFPDRPVLLAPAPNNGDCRSKTYMDFYDKLEREEPDRLVVAQEAS